MAARRIYTDRQHRVANAYHNKWQRENRIRVRTWRRRLMRQKKRMMDKAKAKPCADCRRSFPPVCMDFDHRDPATKLRRRHNIADRSPANFAYIRRACSLKTLLAEMAKCDVVCANCHRLRTARQQKKLKLVQRKAA